MEKLEVFKKWLQDRLTDETGVDVKTELRVLIQLCETDDWDLHIRQRDLSHITALRVSKDIPKPLRDPLVKQLAITTQALRKMREIGIITDTTT
jgi:hypothetical protein